MSYIKRLKDRPGLYNTKVLIKAGEYILCPKCSKRLYRMRQDLRYGDRILSGNFEPVGDNPSPSFGGPGASKCCNQLWLNNACLFTFKGWVPYPPF